MKIGTISSYFEAIKTEDIPIIYKLSAVRVTPLYDLASM
jgi:hypothetical protein